MAVVRAQVEANEIEAIVRKLPTLFDRDDTWYSQIEKKNVEIVSDRDMRVPLEIRPGGNFGMFDPDGGDMGRGDGPTFDKAIVNVVHFKHGVEWTSRAEWATDSSRKAILDTVKHNIAKSMPEFRRHVDSLYMTAGNGVLATVTTVNTTGPNDIVTATTDGFGVRLLRFGQFVHVFSADLQTKRTTGEGTRIVAYDLPNKTVELNPQVTGIVATDVIVVGGSSIPATDPVSLLGVPYHNNASSVGEWLGFDRSTTPEIRSNEVDAAGSSLALPFARLAVNKIGDRLGIDRLRTKLQAWTHPAQVQSYEELGQLAIQIHKTTQDEGLNLYYGENMQLAGAPLKKHFSWDRTRIDFNDMDLWGRAEMHPASMWKDRNGNRFFPIRGASGGVAAAQIFYLTASIQAFHCNPVANSFISNLAVPSGY